MLIAAKQHVVELNAIEATVAVANQANRMPLRLQDHRKSLMLFPPLLRMIRSS